MYWEDRLSEQGLKDVDTAILALRKDRTKRGEDICYDALCGAGMTPDEADEIINVEIENG